MICKVPISLKCLDTDFINAFEVYWYLLLTPTLGILWILSRFFNVLLDPLELELFSGSGYR